VEEWRVLPYGRFDAPHTMAVDEAILRCHLRESNPSTLRLYGWKRPAVSLGYFQKTDETVNSRYCRERGIDIVRRPTGGRAVCHGHDLTYSVVSREDATRFRGGIMETYRLLSECIRRGLKRAGIETAIAQPHGTEDAAEGGGCCFSVPAQYELLAGGRKICGSAQMRVRGVFLQHGSIPLSLDAGDLCMIMNHVPVEDGGDFVVSNKVVTPTKAGVQMLSNDSRHTKGRCLDSRLRGNNGEKSFSYASRLRGSDMKEDSSCASRNAALNAAMERLKGRVTSVDEHAQGPITAEALCRYIEEGFEEFLGIRLVPGGLTDGEKKAGERLLAGKYLTERWNREGRANHEDS